LAKLECGHGHQQRILRAGEHKEDLRGHLNFQDVIGIRHMNQRVVQHDAIHDLWRGEDLSQRALPALVRFAEKGEIGVHTWMQFLNVGFGHLRPHGHRVEVRDPHDERRLLRRIQGLAHARDNRHDGAVYRGIDVGEAKIGLINLQIRLRLFDLSGDRVYLCQPLLAECRGCGDCRLSLRVGCIGRLLLLRTDQAPLCQGVVAVLLTLSERELCPSVSELCREGFDLGVGLPPLRLDPAVLAHIERRFAHRKIPMPDNNRKQAMVPESAEVLPNPNGTAPGLFLKDRGRCIALLPGVPAEMKPLLTEQVIPRIREAFGIGSRIVSRILKTCGISESKVDQAIGDYFREMRNPTIGVLAHAGEIHIRLTCKGDDPATINRLLDDLEGKIRARLGPLIFGRDEEKLEALVGQLLRARQATLAVAESCTGGLLASRLTDIPGSSEYFERGVVAYSTDAKEEILAVPPQFLRDFGAVSLEVARAMADGARRLSGTSFGLAITGIAGPTGGTPEKPVGLVCIALAWEGGHVEREYRLHGGRELIKYRAAQMALEMLRRHLLSVPITES